MSGYINDVFGANGILAQRFPEYTPRDGQVAMAEAVDRALKKNENLIVEAATGTGKSIAYAVPAIYNSPVYVDREIDGETELVKTSILIVTSGIALQEQIVKKDLPMLRDILPEPFRFALVKGRVNYLCQYMVDTGLKTKCHAEDTDKQKQIFDWSKTTPTGDVSELPFEPAPRLWSRFSVTANDCLGKECEFVNTCFANRAIGAAAGAEIVVTNYHMFFAHLRIAEESDGNALVLPDFDKVILDEGHKAADIARDFFGFSITRRAIDRVGGLLDDSTGLDRVNELFFANLESYFKSRSYKSRLKDVNPIESNSLIAELNFVFEEYKGRYKILASKRALSKAQRNEMADLKKRASRASVIGNQIKSAMSLASPDNNDIYYIEDRGNGVALCSKPVRVAEILKRCLFRKKSSVVVTSATISTSGDFDFIESTLGVENPQTLIAESPFNWREQVMVVVPRGLPKPDSSERFTSIVVETFARTVELAQGRTLGLFTSNEKMNAAYERLVGSRFKILKQGIGSKTQLIEEFRRDINSVLLGTNSFWEGVDVPGEALSCVFIDRIPFLSQDDPIVNFLDANNEAAFTTYNKPRAITAFKQGFGRLIRTMTDRGVVVCSDNRLLESNYSREFVRSLPDGIHYSRSLDDIPAFLASREDRESITAVPPPPPPPTARSWLDF